MTVKPHRTNLLLLPWYGRSSFPVCKNYQIFLTSTTAAQSWLKETQSHIWWGLWKTSMPASRKGCRESNKEKNTSERIEEVASTLNETGNCEHQSGAGEKVVCTSWWWIKSWNVSRSDVPTKCTYDALFTLIRQQQIPDICCRGKKNRYKSNATRWRLWAFHITSESKTGPWKILFLKAKFPVKPSQHSNFQCMYCTGAMTRRRLCKCPIQWQVHILYCFTHGNAIYLQYKTSGKCWLL